MQLTGKVALVTGGARRLGRATALELAARGCDVLVHYHRSAEQAGQTVEAIRALGRRAVHVPADLANPAAAQGLVETCVKQLGRLDVLVNNAAEFSPTSPEAFHSDDWQRLLAVNLLAPAALCHHAAAHMKRGGVMVNLCDILAERPWPTYLAYCVSKAGLAALTKGLAKALSPAVRVVGVAPGVAEWPEGFPEDAKARIIDRIPAGRTGTPEEVAAAIRFLIEDGDYITGVVLPVDGGRSIGW